MRERYSSSRANDAKNLGILKTSLFRSVSGIVPIVASLCSVEKCYHFVQHSLAIRSHLCQV